jgi:hypothetical protein
MITKDKIFTFITFTVLFFVVVELLLGKKSSEAALKNSFKNAPVTIVITDSTGKKDTMDFKEYLKRDSTKH